MTPKEIAKAIIDLSSTTNEFGVEKTGNFKTEEELKKYFNGILKDFECHFAELFLCERDEGLKRIKILLEQAHRPHVRILLLSAYLGDCEGKTISDFKRHYIEYLTSKIDELIGQQQPTHTTETPQTGQSDPTTTTEATQPKALADLLTCNNPEDVISNVLIKYKGIKGKRLKLLLMAMQETGIIPPNKINKQFHERFKEVAKWDIASYNAMNGYKLKTGTTTPKGEYLRSNEETDLQSMIDYLNSIINK